MANFYKRHAEWLNQRHALSAQEESGDFPRPDDWHASDDDAVTLLGEARDLLATCAEALSACHEAFVMHMSEQGATFTCSEAGALYDAYRAAGLEALAESFMAYHADTDVEEDLHVPIYSTEFPDCPVGWRDKTEEERRRDGHFD